LVTAQITHRYKNAELKQQTHLACGKRWVAEASGGVEEVQRDADLHPSPGGTWGVHWGGLGGLVVGEGTSLKHHKQTCQQRADCIHKCTR